MPITEVPQRFINRAFVYCRNTDVASISAFLASYQIFSFQSDTINPSVTKFSINAPSDIYNQLAADITLRQIKCVLSRDQIDADITLDSIGANILATATLTTSSTGTFSFSSPIGQAYDLNYVTSGDAWLGQGLGASSASCTLTWDLGTIYSPRVMNYAYVFNALTNNQQGTATLAISADGVAYTTLVSSDDTISTTTRQYAGQVTVTPFRYFRVTNTLLHTTGGAANSKFQYQEIDFY